MVALVLLNFQISPRLRLLNIFWVQEKEPKYYCTSNSQVTPPGSPTGFLCRVLPVSRTFFYISFEPSFIRLSKSTVNKPPYRFPKGAPMERDACLQTLPLHILQGPQ